MLYAARIARLFDERDTTKILFQCEYHGLQGRQLGTILPGRYSFRSGVCNDYSAELETQATTREIEDNLVEVLQPLLTKLYERFSFFELTMEHVQIEIERMRQGRF